jgi:hypothetical protein
MDTRRTFWLSFVDEGSHQFLGVSIVQVDEADAEEAREDLLPQSQPGAEWLLAATQQAYLMGCNPGGQVMSAEVPPEHVAALPLNRLLTKAEAIDLKRRAGE